jgi:hypothetical protein
MRLAGVVIAVSLVPMLELLLKSIGQQLDQVPANSARL